MERLYQYRPARFFLIAYAATWIPWFIGIYLGTQSGLEAYGPLLSLAGLMGPIGATLFMVFSSSETNKAIHQRNVSEFAGFRLSPE